MSDRPTATTGKAAVVPPPASDSTPPDPIPTSDPTRRDQDRDPTRPFGPAPDPVNPLPPVPNAVLDRPHTDHLPAARGQLAEDFRSAVVAPRPVAEPARAALHRLTCDPAALPAFHLPATGTRHPAVVAAATCPDLFVLDAPVGHIRVQVAADIAEQCAAGKQRVLVLTPDSAFADAVTERLARRGDVLRLMLPGEGVERLPPAVLGRTEHVLAVKDAAERRTKLELRIADRTAAVAAIDEWQRHADELHPEAVREAVEASDARRAAEQLRADALTALAAEEKADAQTRTALDAELADLKAQLAKPAGLFKRLIGGSKPDPELTAKQTAAETKLAALGTAASARATKAAEAEATFRTTTARLLADETASRQAEHDTRTQAHREQLKQLGFDDRSDLRDHLSAELADATAELATVNDLPPMLSADARAKLAITVAVFATDPPAGPFDRVVFAAADPLSEAEFLAASVAGRSWVLIGQSGPVVPPPRLARGRMFPGSFFCSVWNAAHRGPWTPDYSTPTVRLVSVPADRQHTATAEPLADRVDIELRLFESATGEPVLSEVRFAPRTPLAEIKRFLADELGELRLCPVGPARWHVTADQLMCCWPAGESAGGRAEWIPLPGGVKEKVSDGTPAGLTVAVSFDPAKWTRATAEEWVARHTAPTPRTAVLPR